MKRALSVLSLAAVAACTGDERAAAGDSALASDLALAQQAGPSAPATFADTAVGVAPVPDPVPERAPAPRRVSVSPAPREDARRRAPGPVVRRPAPRAQAPAPDVADAPAPSPARRGPSLGAGTAIAATTRAQVCTQTNLPGDKIVAVVEHDVAGAEGAVVTAGSVAVLEIASVERGETPERTRITFRVRSLDVNARAYPVVGRVTPEDTLRRTRVEGSNDRRKVVGGIIAGAVLGQVLGRDTRATVIGAAAGGAAGAAAAHRAARWEGCLPAGARVRLIIDEPVLLT